MTERIRDFLRRRYDEGLDDGPCLVVDLDVVRDNYAAFAKALPDSRVFYAVKANPAPELLRAAGRLGSCFDTASVAEIEMVLAAGATPERISFGNTIKKERDIARAYALGVRLFAVDCKAEVDKIARAAPAPRSSAASCSAAPAPNGRCRGSSAATRRWRSTCSSMPTGSGSKPAACRSMSARSSAAPQAWDEALKSASAIFRACAERGISLSMVNLGGGFPTKYLRDVPAVETYGRSIFRALRKHFGNRIPETIIEPGRGMVGNAGVIEAEVVLISKKSEHDEVRWVYLDIGKFGGLAETMDESIRYPISTPRDGDEVGPCVLAGPTCDSCRRDVREAALRSADQPRDRRQGADRRHRGLYRDLLSGRLQRLRPAARLSHLTTMRPPAPALPLPRRDGAPGCGGRKGEDHGHHSRRKDG